MMYAAQARFGQHFSVRTVKYETARKCARKNEDFQKVWKKNNEKQAGYCQEILNSST